MLLCDRIIEADLRIQRRMIELNDALKRLETAKKLRKNVKEDHVAALLGEGLK